MAGVIVTFVIAIVGLTLLLVLSYKGDGRKRRADHGDAETSIAGLSGASLIPFDVFGCDDYRKLRMKPELKPLRKQFWRDRRRIVLLWLGELEKDISTLWKFRRFVVRNGLPVTFREEVAALFAASIALLYLRFVSAGVFVFGPFALPEALKNAESLVRWLSHSFAAPLSRVSAPRKAEIERGWSQQLLATGAKAG